MNDMPGGNGQRERAPITGTIAEYEQRRCVVCGGRYPPFGFGPPLTRPGAEIWACGQHRSVVEARFAKPEPSPGAGSVPEDPF
jgi:hypothetical protein